VSRNDPFVLNQARVNFYRLKRESEAADRSDEIKQPRASKDEAQIDGKRAAKVLAEQISCDRIYDNHSL